jgi:4-methyl-5(b-hydroxyethyl)-thiazole monophosphate biosynthesis
MVRVLIAVANGSEEIETLTPVDLLRRAGAEVILAASGLDRQVTLSRGVVVIADDLISNVARQDFDCIVVPGGQPGSDTLSADDVLIAALQQQKLSDKWHAAICAAPVVVFQPHGLLEGSVATCYPKLAGSLHDASRASERVVVSNKCITSQGPGTALEFSLELIRQLFGEHKAAEVGAAVLT